MVLQEKYTLNNQLEVPKLLLEHGKFLMKM